MAYSFGGGINPQLGAVDYSPILRGAQQYAQSTAAGSAAIGQGLGSALASLGQGVQQYAQNQEKSRMMIGELQNIIQNDPEAIKNIDQKVIKQVESGDIRFKDLQQTYANVVTGQKMKAARQAAEDQRKIAIGMSALSYGKTRPLDAIRGSGEALTPGVVNFFAQLENLQSQTAKNYADARPKGIEGYPAGLSDVLELQGKNLDVDAVPTGKDTVMIRKIGTFAKPPQTTVNVGKEDAYGKAAGEMAAKRDNDLYQAAVTATEDNIPRLIKARKLVESGNVNTGMLADIRTEIDRFKSLVVNDPKSGKRASDTQILDALQGSRVFNLFQQLGVGARGLDTPAERDFMLQVLTGTKKLEAPALIELIDLSLDKEYNTIDRFNSRLKGGSMKRFFESQGFEAQPFNYQRTRSPFSDQLPPKTAQEIRVDPATGKRYTKDANGNVVEVK